MVSVDMLVVETPTPEEAVEIIKAKTWKAMIILLGECSVTYEGRAKSFLDYGERLVIIKKDGSLLVHSDEKREPVNWQPPGTKPTYHLIDGSLVIKVQRTKPYEYIRVDFRRINLLTRKELADDAQAVVSGMEEDIVAMILDNPSMIEEGLRVSKKEKRTSSGSIDLFCRDSDNLPVILEVKRGLPGVSAVYQLEAYVRDFKRKNSSRDIRAFLVAPRIPLMVKNMLREKGFEYREIRFEHGIADESQTNLGKWA